MNDRRRKMKIFVNLLSVSRIIGALLMPILFYICSIPVLMIIVVSLFITDCIDGRIARAYKVQTKGGSLLDPLGDKILAVSCILTLAWKNHFLIIPFILELVITLVNVYRTLHEEIVNTSIFGKVKTTLLSIALVLSAIYTLKPDLLNFIITEEIVNISTSIAIGAQILTIVFYFEESFKQKGTRSKKIPKLKDFRGMMKRLFDENKYEEDRNKSLMEILKK